MARMRYAVALFAVFALAACAAPADAPAPLLAADLSCDAASAEQCPAGGCRNGQAPEDNPTPISVSVPANPATTLARFCIATGCEDARIERAMLLDGMFRSRLITNERTAMRMELEIAANRRTFTLVHATPQGVSTWRGACNVAGS